MDRNEYNEKLASITSILVGSVSVCYMVKLIELNNQIPVKIENISNVCCHCLETDAIQFCGKCRFASYCNVQCQQIHWKLHQKDCYNLAFKRTLQNYPLFRASCEGDLITLKNIILEEGTDINMEIDDFSAIFIASQELGSDMNKSNCTISY